MSDNNAEFISIGKAANMIGVSLETLRNWDREDKFKPIRTIGKHRRYSVKQINIFTGTEDED